MKYHLCPHPVRSAVRVSVLVLKDLRLQYHDCLPARTPLDRSYKQCIMVISGQGVGIQETESRVSADAWTVIVRLAIMVQSGSRGWTTDAS